MFLPRKGELQCFYLFNVSNEMVEELANVHLCDLCYGGLTPRHGMERQKDPQTQRHHNSFSEVVAV